MVKLGRVMLHFLLPAPLFPQYLKLQAGGLDNWYTKKAPQLRTRILIDHRQ